MTAAAYRYRAARPDGSLENGVMSAEGETDVRVRLDARGCFALAISREAPADAHTSKRKLSSADLALGFRALATLIESGLPMSKALAAFEDLAPQSWHSAIPTLRQSIREGSGLGDALRETRLDIPPMIIGIVKAGEAGSGLATAVRRSAEIAERNARTREAVRNALAYPVVLLVAGSIALVLLVGIVIPRFSAILGDLGQSIPATTRAVLAIGGFVRVSAIPGLVIGALAVVIWRMWTAVPDGRAQWCSMLLRIPVIGAIRLSSASSRVCESIASLLDSGVTLAPAMMHATSAVADEALMRRLLIARTSVIRGEQLSAAFARTHAVTHTVVRLARAGEETGRLAEMLHHAARLNSEHAEVTVRRLVSMLEPALILGFGGVVAFVAAALLQAVYTIQPTR